MLSVVGVGTAVISSSIGGCFNVPALTPVVMPFFISEEMLSELNPAITMLLSELVAEEVMLVIRLLTLSEE